jgi:hypothetical protein
LNRYLLFKSIIKMFANGQGLWPVGECGAAFSSPDENDRAGETAPKFQCQPTLATPLVRQRIYLYFNSLSCSISVSTNDKLGGIVILNFSIA